MSTMDLILQLGGLFEVVNKAILSSFVEFIASDEFEGFPLWGITIFVPLYKPYEGVFQIFIPYYY